MEKEGLICNRLQEIPDSSLVLLSGPPGAGKSTFCHQAVLNSLAMDRPVIFITTEHSASEIVDLLQTRGLGEPLPGALSFFDAFSETVGATTEVCTDTLGANWEDLNSISMAIDKLRQRLGKKIFSLFLIP